MLGGAVGPSTLQDGNPTSKQGKTLLRQAQAGQHLGSDKATPHLSSRAPISWCPVYCCHLFLKDISCSSWSGAGGKRPLFSLMSDHFPVCISISSYGLFSWYGPLCYFPPMCSPWGTAPPLSYAEMRASWTLCSTESPRRQWDIILVLFTLLIIRPSKRPQAGNPT